MNTYVFIIKALTNLHAGSGDAGGYGLVDKVVQRDPTTNLPTIHASGIKGALREHFKAKSWVVDVFGSAPKDRDEKDIKRGEYRFFAADLVALPKPKNDPPHYSLVGSPKYLEDLKEKYQDLGASTINLLSQLEIKDAEDFSELAEDLPVIARNHLENGISQNLWYEEIVPRTSIFITSIQAPNHQQLIGELHDKVIQIGGNATVGYGYCKFEKI